jgi:hypothetical protein
MENVHWRRIQARCGGTGGRGRFLLGRLLLGRRLGRRRTTITSSLVSLMTERVIRKTHEQEVPHIIDG